MFLLLAAVTLALQPGDQSQQLEFLRVSYKANKDAFAFGTFRFEYTRGACKSVADAEAGIFDRSIKEDGFYVFDGKNARYDLVAQPQDLAASTRRIGANKTVSTALSHRMLTDGDVTLLDMHLPDRSGESINHSVATHRGRLFYQDGYFQFPLSLGDSARTGYDLASDLNFVKAGVMSLAEIDFDSRLDGLKVCKLSITWEKGKFTYLIDLNREAVPLRISAHYNPTNSDSVYIFADVVRVPDAGWLPRRWTRILANGAVVDRIVVTEIDVQRRPPRAVFALDFPKAIALLDTTKHLSYAPRKSWSLLSLPGRSDRGTRLAFPSTYVSPADLPGESEASAPWVVPVAACTIVLLLLGCVLIIVKRRTSALRRV
jgi:hypothetical protein